MSSVYNTGSSPVSSSSPNTSSAQSRIDAANNKIDGLQTAITNITENIASLQALIAELQAELAGLEAPSANDFWKNETRYEGTPPRPHAVRVFDSAAFNRAMSTYLSKVNALQTKIQAKQVELAKKETELGKKTNELNAAKKELTAACSELQKTMSGSALVEAMKRHEEYRERARKLEQEALKAQAQAQKAQDDLKKANEELQKTKDAALELGGYDKKAAAELDKKLATWDPKSQTKPPFQQTGKPTAKQIEAYQSAVKAAEKNAKGMLQDATNALPAIKNGELLPPVDEVSARDYIEVIPELASYETGAYAKDAGLLTDFAADGKKPVSADMRTQMIEAWVTAGFSTDEIAAAMKNIGLTADPTAQAKKDYEDIKASHSDPKHRGPAFADALVENKNDLAYQVAMIELAKEDTDGFMSHDAMMSPSGSGIFSRQIKGDYSVPHYTDEEREVFTLAMRAARDAGVYTDAELKKLASDGPGLKSCAWQELVNRIGVKGVPESPLAIMAATKEVKGAQEAYNIALEAKDQANQELAAQMAGFDKAITDEQRRRYMEAYWRDHKDVVEAYDKATAKLADTLTRCSPVLENAAVSGPEKEAAVELLYEGYKSLATAPQAKDAMDFVVRVNSSKELTAAFEGKDLTAGIFGPAADSVSGQLLTDPNTTPDEGLAKLEKLYRGYLDKLEQTVEEAVGNDRYAWSFYKFKTGITELVKGIRDLRKMCQGTFKPATLADQIKAWEKKGVFLKRLAITGAIFAFGAAYSNAKAGDEFKAVADLARGLKLSSPVMTGVLGSYARAGQCFAGQAKNAAKLVNRFTPLIGAVTNGLMTCVDFREAINDGNAGDWLAVAGDCCAFAGACVTCTGVGLPVGAALQGVGMLISGVGVTLSGVIDKQELREAQIKYLQTTGMSKELAEIMVEADEEQITALSAIGLTPKQIQSLATTLPELVQNHNNRTAVYLGNLAQIGERVGYSGQQMYDMLTIAAQGDDPSYQVSEVLCHFSRSDDSSVAHRLEIMKKEGATQKEMQKYVADSLRELADSMPDDKNMNTVLSKVADSLAP